MAKLRLEHMDATYKNLETYYRTCFPAATIYQWLTVGIEDPQKRALFFRNREIIFKSRDGTFPRVALTKGTPEEFAQLVIKKMPERLENVSCNNVPYHERRLCGPGFTRLERDLGFDIDIDDYNAVRKCCAEGALCSKCWKPLMGTAIKFLEAFLRDVYGFEHTMWVFSGRRGMHCWVLDPRARKMTFAARVALVTHLQTWCSIQKASLNVHHAVREFDYESVPKVLRDIIAEGLRQYFHAHPQVFSNEAMVDMMAHTLFDEVDYRADAEKLRSMFIFHFHRPAQDKLASEIFAEWLRVMPPLLRSYVPEIIYKLGMALCGPRIDENVTKSMSHAQKLPFCVHPKTQAVCLVMDASEAVQFFPDAEHVVRVDDLVPRDNSATTKAAVARMENSVDVFRKLVGQMTEVEQGRTGEKRLNQNV